MISLFIPPLEIGERIVVSRWEDIMVTISKIEWIETEDRFKIHLDWGEHGSSYVYSSDEGTVWRRYLEVN